MFKCLQIFQGNFSQMKSFLSIWTQLKPLSGLLSSSLLILTIFLLLASVNTSLSLSHLEYYCK